VENKTIIFTAPYSTFHDGEPVRIPYVVDGLLTQGGFSALAGKPKHGKSSLARCEAVCVAKGSTFLGRATEKGEVILASLEDPLNHTDNCLRVLDYDPKLDAKIHITNRLPLSIEDTVESLGDVLSKSPDVRLVIIDTLAKAIRVRDLNEYMVTLAAVEQLRELARSFPRVHVQGLVHCKKVAADDPFDGILGSTALRGEPDTNVVLFDQSGQRVIETETRIGRNIPATILKAELVESAGADVVRNFSLGSTFSQWEKEKPTKENARAINYEQCIIDFLQQNGFNATQEEVLVGVRGNRASLLEAIACLSTNGVLLKAGTKNSKSDPTRLFLSQVGKVTNNFINNWSRAAEVGD
jgi:hypothetical protein